MDTHKTLLHNGENYIQLQVNFLGVWEVWRKKNATSLIFNGDRYVLTW